jgi:hypothetical protein
VYDDRGSTPKDRKSHHNKGTAHMNNKPQIFGLLLAMSLGPALAQNSNAINLTGTVDQFSSDSLIVKGSDGTTETFTLSPNLLVLQNKRAKLADIKPNDFVASAAVRKLDGKLHSTEVRIFPDALRGRGEGQRPMNDAQGQTMTNAAVTGAVIANGSNDLQVKFHGGDSELVVDPGVPVTRISVVDKTMVTSGARVRVQGVHSADGAATVNQITLQ